MKKQYVAVALVVVCVMGWYKISLRSVVEAGKAEEVKGEEKSPEQAAADTNKFLQEQVEQELAKPESERTEVKEQPKITIEKARTNLTDAYTTGENIAQAQQEVITAVTEAPEQQLQAEQTRLQQELQKTAEQLGKGLEVAGPEPAPEVTVPGANEKALFDSNLAEIKDLGEGSADKALVVLTNEQDYVKTVDTKQLRSDLKKQSTIEDKKSYLASKAQEIKSMIDAIDTKLTDLNITVDLNAENAVQRRLSQVKVELETAHGKVTVEQANIETSKFKSFLDTLRRFRTKVASFLGIAAKPEVNLASELTKLGVFGDLATVRGAAGSVANLSTAINTLNDISTKGGAINESDIQAINSAIGVQEIGDVPEAAVQAADQLYPALSAIVDSRVVIKTKGSIILDIQEKYVDASVDAEYTAVTPVRGAQEFETFFEYTWDRYRKTFKNPITGNPVETLRAYETIFKDSAVRTALQEKNITVPPEPGTDGYTPAQRVVITQEQLNIAYEALKSNLQSDGINAALYLSSPVNRAVYDAFLADADTAGITPTNPVLNEEQQNRLKTQGELIEWAVTKPDDILAIYKARNDAQGFQTSVKNVPAQVAQITQRLGQVEQTAQAQQQQAQQEITGQLGGF